MIDVNAFIDRWRASGASERANFGLFATELCDLLEVPRPDPAGPDTDLNAYVFERSVTFHHADGSTRPGRIDLYKRGCFVLEAKQGSAPTVETPLFGLAPTAAKRGTARRGSSQWDEAMKRAKNQAEGYVRALPVDEGRPPFIVVVDVGHSIELYSEFSRSGGEYVPYPDPQSHRILLDDLADEEVRDLLRAVWTEPLSLDPTRRGARVTREIADKLARLARSLEATGGFSSDRVAAFLMRAIFTMFAEDVWLLPDRGFRQLLESLRGHTERFAAHIEPLWRVMNEGGYSPGLRADVPRFNGGLFSEQETLPLTEQQLELLIEAASADWRDVEPAIFGTLLERALDPRERHKLGAHYTPRAYVERLVVPTVIEPLRSEWQGVQAAVVSHRLRGKPKDAESELRAFHQRLCSIKVLDPACGSGNFLYVTLDHLKRIEGEVVEALESVTGEDQASLDMHGATVSPEQLLGLEINPRAAKIAELVLWIGYLQWHFRTHGNVPPAEPILRDLHNIENRDALLEYDGTEVVIGDDGEPVTRWDDETFVTHLTTGRQVPDSNARVAELRYLNPRKATWPRADFVVGNPPFIGTSRMREALGDGYATTLRRVHDDVPESADLVMYWWNHAAKLVDAGRLRAFGFVTTNSIRQTFNRRVLQRFLQDKPRSTPPPSGWPVGKSRVAPDGLSLSLAIPDHPWVDSADGAAVRIAMTAAVSGDRDGLLRRVVHEIGTGNSEYEVEFVDRVGEISSDLTIGADVSSAMPLRANERLSNRGVQLFGAGFIVTPEQAADLGLRRIVGLEKHIQHYRNGRDLTQTPRDVMVIDLYGLEENEVRERFPEVYQWVRDRVKPERDANPRRSRRENWWLFGETNPKLRDQLAGLDRYIATVETSKHRFFTFLDDSILPDNMLVNIALDDAYFLGVLSSRVHVVWALASGGTLEDRPRYNKTRCFEPFPFPAPTPQQLNEIRNLGAAIDSHRKQCQAEHPGLTLTGIYNVMEKLRAGSPLGEPEHEIYSQGLVGVLKEFHDELDSAVLDAYGWSVDISDAELLANLVELNAARAEEEARGEVRWLRPEYQDPESLARAAKLGMTTPRKPVTKDLPRIPWPTKLAFQAQSVRGAVILLDRPVTAKQVTTVFDGAQPKRVKELLETLAALGQVTKVDGEKFAS